MTNGAAQALQNGPATPVSSATLEHVTNDTYTQTHSQSDREGERERERERETPLVDSTRDGDLRPAKRYTAASTLSRHPSAKAPLAGDEMQR